MEHEMPEQLRSDQSERTSDIIHLIDYRLLQKALLTSPSLPAIGFNLDSVSDEWSSTENPSRSQSQFVNFPEASYSHYVQRLDNKTKRLGRDLSYFWSVYEDRDEPCWGHDENCISTVIFAQTLDSKLEFLLTDVFYGHMNSDRLQAGIDCLRNPSQQVQTQLIILRSEMKHGLVPILDQLGVLYKVNPEFFRAACVDVSVTGDRSRPRNYWWIPPMRRSFLVDEDLLAAQVFKWDGANGREITVVFVHLGHSFERPIYLCDGLKEYPDLPFPKFPATKTTDVDSISQKSNAKSKGRLEAWLASCAALIFQTRLRTWSTELVQLADDNPYVYLLPLVELKAEVSLEQIRLLSYGAWVRQPFPASDPCWIIEQGPDRMKEILSAITTASDTIINFERFYESLLERIDIDKTALFAHFPGPAISYRETISMARSRLAILRDCMQYEVALLTTEESRKSIEEAAAVRRLSQLAFIFIPLSYVNSIYGMNILEWTGSGVRVWVFVVTSGVMTFLSISLWWLHDRSRKTRRSPDEVGLRTRWDRFKRVYITGPCTVNIAGWLKKRKDEERKSSTRHWHLAFFFCWSIFQKCRQACQQFFSDGSAILRWYLNIFCRSISRTYRRACEKIFGIQRPVVRAPERDHTGTIW